MAKPKRRTKPRLFVGSSKESLSVARAVQKELDHDAEVVVWTQGIFQLSESTLESLMKALARFDFGVFVFAPNDALKLRNRKYAAVRDNVTFEFGLFVGRLGKSRVFYVAPDAPANLRIFTDLAGITGGRYDAKRKDRNLQAALAPFCDDVRVRLKRFRPRKARRQ